MSARIVRLGTPRGNGEGLRLGTVRRPPRGVKKEDTARRDFYDVWLPNLSPSPELFHAWRAAPDEKTIASCQKKFRSEMRVPEAAHLLDVLAALSHQTDFSLGCYCEDEARCHRSVLRALLQERGADLK